MELSASFFMPPTRATACSGSLIPNKKSLPSLHKHGTEDSALPPKLPIESATRSAVWGVPLRFIAGCSESGTTAAAAGLPPSPALYALKAITFFLGALFD